MEKGMGYQLTARNDINEKDFNHLPLSYLKIYPCAIAPAA
jgi:hypothetical protein